MLLGQDFAPLASGAHEWENRLEAGVWTYGLNDVWSGIQVDYKNLDHDVQTKSEMRLAQVGGQDITARMYR